MRWATVAAVVFVWGCGARSEIAGEPDSLDASALDGATLDGATLDGSMLDVTANDVTTDGAEQDVAADAPLTPLCCDDGFKKSGCQTCAAGQTCIAKMGTCVVASVKCGPSNCDGCCLDETTCADGREVGACGTHGQMCQTCSGKNGYGACIPDDVGGTCQGGDTCTPGNCISGCCNGNVCMVGDQDTLCGPGGACVDCTLRGGVCVKEACTK